MKKKKSTMYPLMKKLFCFVLIVAMVFSNLTLVQAEERTTVTEEELVAKTNPILKSYEISDASKLFAVTGETRFVVEATDVNIANERLAEVVKLVNAEFVEKGISAMAHAMVYAPEALPTDVYIRLVSVEEITDETESDEAYKITISADGVVIEAASENAVMYALRTIQNMMITNDGLVYGTIVDYPDVAERRLHVDCARKYISKDWFIRQIREMSYLKMNTIQIHFSENMGFRIECETDPAIVSEDHLTKAEVREILAEAKKYGIKVIPSFDSPGHVDQILRAHPEYGQVNSSGQHYASGLDVTNPEAVAYIYSLYDEYMELFEGCTDFHIGGDEYMEFDRPPFTTEYKSVLNAYAVEKWGQGYTWKDTMSNYINELAEYVYSKGFKPRIFNDGIYYGENDSEGPQKIQMHDYIGIDFWSQMSWNSSIARLQTFIDKGHTDIYNFNASYFYYVLRGSMPTDGREQHSFDVLNQDANIYNNWTPGKFQSNTISDDHESISGVSMAIWCDYADICTEDVITEDIASALRSLASKSWNTSSNSILDFEGFTALTEELGNVAGFEKGSELPDVGEFMQDGELGKVIIKYVDEAGNTIKADGAKYGVFGDAYSLTAPEIYKWIAVSEEAVTGTFSEDVQTVTFVYKKDPNPATYLSTMATYPSVGSYQTTGDKFALTDESRLVVISSDFTLQNEVLENDLKLLSSEFTETGLTDESMLIVYGTETTPKAGDIVIRMEEPSDDVSPEGYTIDIDGYAEVTATGEEGIFYGIRTIQKTLLLNDGQMDDGKITDEPAVGVRAFHLDNARKFFTKDWVLALIKDLSYQNINELQYHFSENEGFRLESSTLEALEGWSYPSDGYYTKADILEIIEECNKYHIEFIPSLDSPGHMTYVLNHLPDGWDCTGIWPSDWRSEQTFNIFEKEECKEFLVTLFTEYAEYFSEAGCKHMNIGGDEFLNNFGSMTNDQYIIVMNYFNDIAALVKSYGLTPRAWNDGLLYTGYEGYELDPDIEICYWSGPAQCATIADFVENGNKVINYADVYMYFALSSWWMSNANASGEKIFNEWTPGKLANSSVVGDQSVEYPYPDYVLGASYALWCDDPDYMTQESVANHLFLRTRAMAEKSWNPNTTLTYSQFQSNANKLGRAPGYDGEELPAPGDVLYEGEFGTIVLRYVDEEGNALKSDRTVYGVLGDAYKVEPEAIYGYRFVEMDKAAEGVFGEDEVVYTLTYELYTDKSAMIAEVENVLDAKDYIPATYANYKAAIEEAVVIIENPTIGQAEVDSALEALLDAKAELISVDRVDLYMEVMYPIAAAGYTTGSYNTYKSAVNAGNMVLHDAEATAEDIAEALEAIQNAKASLAAADMITVTANKSTYSDYSGNYSLNNMIDGNTGTKMWTSGPQAIDDWFLFTFASPITLNGMSITYPDNADYLRGGVIEISTDSQTWETVGTFNNTTNPTTNTFEMDGVTAQYVRIRLTEGIGNWAQVNEVTFDYVAASVDTAELEAAIAEAKELKEADYSVGSWVVLQAAIEKAEAVAAKEGVTLAEISAALSALSAAVAELRDPSFDAPIEKPEPPVEECKHTETEVQDVKEATCTEEGYTGDTVCVDCGKTIETGKKVDKLGHDFSTEWTVVKEATTEEKGLKERECTRCDAKETQDIPKLEKPPVIEPEKPVSPTVTPETTTEDSISLTWSEVKGAVKYNVIVDGKVVKTIMAGEELAYTVEGLKAGVSYKVGVVAVDANEVASEATEFTVKLSAENDEPSIEPVEPETNEPGSPVTGDNAMTMIYMMMMAACFAVVVMKRRRA